MYYYQYHDKILASSTSYEGLEPVSKEQAAMDQGVLYYLVNLKPGYSRSSFALSHSSLMDIQEEGLHLLRSKDPSSDLPQWLLEKIKHLRVKAVNTAYKDWKDHLDEDPPKKWRIHLSGIGDVGSTLLMGLRLLGGDCIKEIGIYDRDLNKLQRWEFEINQIVDINQSNLPPVRILKEEEVFDCDLFAFCITTSIPAVGEEKVDVRMVQFEGNSKIVSTYSRMARSSGYQGIFAVVSDPVDLLCKSAYLASNEDHQGNLDYRGLKPEQIRGYGLGVMNARALYYAQQCPDTVHFKEEGRVFGPHGADLVVADSIENYNEERSLNLTYKTIRANLKLRSIGFKPYIAPALSSGALSLIATIKGDWHYSATFMGGVYMGAKNRLTPVGTEIEMLNLPDHLYSRLENTYRKLRDTL